MTGGHRNHAAITLQLQRQRVPTSGEHTYNATDPGGIFPGMFSIAYLDAVLDDLGGSAVYDGRS